MVFYHKLLQAGPKINFCCDDVVSVFCITYNPCKLHNRNYLKITVMDNIQSTFAYLIKKNSAPGVGKKHSHPPW